MKLICKYIALLLSAVLLLSGCMKGDDTDRQNKGEGTRFAFVCSQLA